MTGSPTGATRQHRSSSSTWQHGAFLTLARQLAPHARRRDPTRRRHGRPSAPALSLTVHVPQPRGCVRSSSSRWSLQRLLRQSPNWWPAQVQVNARCAWGAWLEAGWEGYGKGVALPPAPACMSSLDGDTVVPLDRLLVGNMAERSSATGADGRSQLAGALWWRSGEMRVPFRCLQAVSTACA